MPEKLRMRSSMGSHLSDLTDFCHKFLEKVQVKIQKGQQTDGKTPLLSESRNCVWLGISDDHKGHKFYDLDSGRLIHARIGNAKFLGTFHDFSDFTEIEEEDDDGTYTDSQSENGNSDSEIENDANAA